MDAEELMTGKSAVLDQAALERKMTGMPDALDQSAIDQAGFWGQTKSVTRDLTGQVGGIAATAVDMLAGVPRVLSIPGSWAIHTAALAKGESPRIAAGAALAYQQEFLPDWMQGAWGKIATAMGPQAEEYYKTNQLAKLMDLLNSGIDKAGKIGEKAGLPEDYIRLIAGQTMDLLGFAGVRVGLGKSMWARAEAAKDAVMARQYTPYEQTPREKFLTENPQRTPDPTPKPQGAAELAALKEAEARMAAWNKANPQFRQQDASLFMQDVVEAGRASGAAEVARRNYAEAQAAEAARTRTQADFEAQMTGARPPAEAAPAGAFPAARETGPWTPREATPEGRPLAELVYERDFAQSSLGQGLAKVSEGKLWDLTAAERVALKGHERELSAVTEASKHAGFRNVRGAADPKLLAYIATATGLGIAAWNTYKNWEVTQPTPENEKPEPQPKDRALDGKPLFTAEGLGETAALAGVITLGKSKLTALTEPKLIELARSGHKEAVTELYNREAPKLERVLTRVLKGDAAKAQDLVQETMASAFQALKKPLNEAGGFRGDSKLSTWLYRNALNKASNLFTAEGRRISTVEMEEVPDTAAATTRTPEDLLQNKQLGERLQEGLKNLEPEQRAAFEAKEFNGDSYEQIAAAQGVPIGTVRSRIFRAKEALQKALKDVQRSSGRIERGAADPELLSKLAIGTGLGIAAWSGMTSGGQPFFVTDREVETGLVTGAMLIGAIKTPGGFFPYTTIEKIAKPFIKNIDISKEMKAIPGIRELPQAEQIAKATELYDKAAAAPRRMVKNWLTKYAGTSADPLNNITIPVAIKNDAFEIIGTKPVRWEDLIEQILKKSAPNTAGKRTVGNYVAYPNLKELPENEASWTIGEYNAGGEAYDPRTEVATRADRKPAVSFETLKKEDVLPFKEQNAYVSAFNSFLEHAGDYYRTLDPVKRNMYDFPRLIKETLADDAKKAKEASAYKESSKKARLESVAGADVVASYPEVELPERLLHRNSPEGTSAKNMVDETLPAEKVKFSWVQLKKPGQFYDEGRFMGHSVGGYDIVEGQPGWTAASGTAKQNTYASDYYGHGGYDAIKSGEAEVYSLRDNQGNSYATVEVAKEDNGSSSITQIKGPGNQHVAAEAQKYAQDIATDPRWDSVRSVDLDKIGFTSETFKAAQEARKGNPSNFLPKAEQGSVDPRLLKNLALLGGGAAAGAWLDPEHPIAGAFAGLAVGAGLAAISPKAIFEAYRRAQQKGTLVKIDNFTDATEANRRIWQRAAESQIAKINDVAPTEARREAIYKYLENEERVDLSPAEKKMAGEVRGVFDTLGDIAKSAGVVHELLTDYATRIYKKDRGFFETRPDGTSMPLSSPFGKPRGYKTRAEAEAAGYVPLTMDIGEVLRIYSDSVIQAVENNKFIDAVRGVELPDKSRLIMKAGKAPANYVYIDHPQLKESLVHPDIAADLRFMFDTKNPGAFIKAVDAVNSTQKRLGVSLSLFHAMALEHAMLGATAILKSPARGVRILAQSFAPALFGENLAVKMVREGGAGDAVEAAIKDGLQFGFERAKPTIMEEQLGVYKAIDATSQFLDDLVPGAGKYTLGAVGKLNHMFDRAMWGRFHTAMKLETYWDKVAELSRNNARDVEAGKAAPKSREEIGKIAASFTNDAFGGLDWHGMVHEFNSRWGREVASAAFSPSGRLGMRLALFAPDWTISTTRAFVKGFGQQGVAAGVGAALGMQLAPEGDKGIGAGLGLVAGLLGGKAAGLQAAEGSGIKGLLRPTELADLHRQYFMRSALIYTTIVNALNNYYSGHNLWENKDPTRLDRGDGTTQQVSKHFMEPFHWLLEPRQQMMNKLSFAIKEPLAQLQDVEYLSTKGAPRMGLTSKGEDIPLSTRLGHFGRQFAPISAQGFDASNPQRAAASMLGAPIYGRTDEEKAQFKREAVIRRIQRREEKRRRDAEKRS